MESARPEGVVPDASDRPPPRPPGAGVAPDTTARLRLNELAARLARVRTRRLLREFLELRRALE
mgnify:FL=1